MKPVEKENHIEKFKSIVRDVEGNEDLLASSMEVLDKTNAEIETMDDHKESFAMIIFLSVCILGLCGYLIYEGAYVPWLVIVLWVGTVMYYVINEQGLKKATLVVKSQIDVANPITKFNHVQQMLDEKLDRINLTVWISTLFWPMVLTLGQQVLHKIENQLAVTGIFLSLLVVNYFFWRHFFKPQRAKIADHKKTLFEASTRLIMG